MPYHHIEELGDRSQERFALGLGARNVAGMVVGAFPILLLSSGWPIILRLPALLAAIITGLLLTIDISGLATYEWPLWWLRGRMRRLAHGRSITPTALPGVAQQPMHIPLRVGGPIRASRRRNLRARRDGPVGRLEEIV
jgi:hypothetical protein